MATPTFNNSQSSPLLPSPSHLPPRTVYTHMTTLLTPTPTHPAAADLATPGKKKRTTGSTPLPKSTLKSGAPGAGGYDSYADTEQVLDGESRKMLEGALSVSVSPPSMFRTLFSNLDVRANEGIQCG